MHRKSAVLILKSLGYEYLYWSRHGGSSELSNKKFQELPNPTPPETLVRWVLIFLALAGRIV
jgi:hypothetical protein